MSTPASIWCISTESQFQPAMASPNIWRFLESRKVKKAAPEISKTILVIKRYTDFLYILGDLCLSARNCHVTCNPRDLKIDPGKFTNNKVPEMM